MNGYLAPVATPHIYRHVHSDYHRLLHALVMAMTEERAASEGGYSYRYAQNRVFPAIRRVLHIRHSPGSADWRVALTRLYYGVDRCWCQQ